MTAKKSAQQVAVVGLEPVSENPEKTSEISESTDPGGAESGALSGSLAPSPHLSTLVKLVAELTAGERAALARTLGGSEGG